MRRRDLLVFVAGATTLRQLVAGAQQTTMPVVGFLAAGSFDADPSLRLRGPIHQGLSETGYIDGENYTAEYRGADYHYERLPELAADLVSRKVAVIVTTGGSPPALATKSATSTIPIVFANVADPVGVGLVANLARPGGNVTGFANVSIQLTPKRIELLSELVPQARVIALLVNPTNPTKDAEIALAREAADTKGLQLVVLEASSEGEIDASFVLLAQQHAAALVVNPDDLFNRQIKRLLTLTSDNAVPAIFPARSQAVSGGLISYGIDAQAINRQAGVYAGRILKGEKPADLPIQQPTKFELVINLKTATALGLIVPPTLLARANEVIE
jgi:putative ABC transport system substrate-binding protein